MPEREYLILGSLNDPERLHARIYEQFLTRKPLELSVIPLEPQPGDEAAEQLSLHLIKQERTHFGFEFEYHPIDDPHRIVKISISDGHAFLAITTT